MGSPKLSRKMDETLTITETVVIALLCSSKISFLARHAAHELIVRIHSGQSMRGGIWGSRRRRDQTRLSDDSLLLADGSTFTNLTSFTFSSLGRRGEI